MIPLFSPVVFQFAEMHQNLLSSAVFYPGSLYSVGLLLFFFTDTGGQGGEKQDGVKCMCLYGSLSGCMTKEKYARCAFGIILYESNCQTHFDQGILVACHFTHNGWAYKIN